MFVKKRAPFLFLFSNSVYFLIYFLAFIWNEFLLGFITNVFNPKATLFFLSLFTVVIDVNTPIFVKIFYGFWMSSITGLWFLFVSFIFTSSLSKIFISRFSGLIDKIMGFILIIISVKILLF